MKPDDPHFFERELASISEQVQREHGLSENPARMPLARECCKILDGAQEATFCRATQIRALKNGALEITLRGDYLYLDAPRGKPLSAVFRHASSARFFADGGDASCRLFFSHVWNLPPSEVK